MMKNQKYPKLMKVLTEMAQDNDLELLSNPEFPENVDVLESQAEKLSTYEIGVMAYGEESEAKALVKTKGLRELEMFLIKAFDFEVAIFDPD